MKFRIVVSVCTGCPFGAANESLSLPPNSFAFRVEGVIRILP